MSNIQKAGYWNRPEILMPMNTNNVKRSSSLTIVVALITLILGVAIGVAVAKYAGSASTPAQKTQASVTAATSPNTGSAAASETTDPLQEMRTLQAGMEKMFQRSLERLQPTPSAVPPAAAETWDPFAEMRSMQDEMDRMFQGSIERFQMNPQMDNFKDQAGYWQSLDVRNLKDRYEVRAVLPDAEASDASVKLNGNQLTVEVTNQQTKKQQTGNEQTSATEMGRYEQVVQLAGNLDADQMKVARKNHELLITIPKA
jgi:HSP20 family molecular chaperone IbpA